MFNHDILAPGIVSYKNVLQDTESFIKKIEDYIKDKTLTWSDTIQHSEYENKEFKKIRECKRISLPAYDDNELLVKNSSLPVIDNISARKYAQLSIHNFLNKSLYGCINDYKKNNKALDWSKSEGWQILKYEKDDYFENHVDDMKQNPRTVSMVFYLNDNYEGGEIEFSKFNLNIKPEKNEMILFPSNYIYGHKAKPVISGVKYVIVGWWN